LGRLVAAKPVLWTTTDEDNFQKVACVYESLHLLACEICGWTQYLGSCWISSRIGSFIGIL